MAKQLLYDPADCGQEVHLKVNEDYARRLAHNKEREALRRLQELKKNGVVSSSSESSTSSEDDEDDGAIPLQTEAQFWEVLAKIKNKDPSIYEERAKFFDDSDDEQEDNVKQKQKKSKPVYLKDALAHQLIDEGPDFDETKGKNRGIVTYDEEQQALKREFLCSAEFPDDDDDNTSFLRLRQKSEQEPAAESEQDLNVVARLEEYFGKDEKLNDNEKFLKEFLQKKSWIVENQDQLPSYDEAVGDDEEELEKQDIFEAQYNFRFEEDSGWQLMGHSRVFEGSVRRSDDSRRQKRLQKQKRLSEAAFERREELKRLKNVKKREILQKLEKIRTVAGAKTSDPSLLPLLQAEDLEEDFDPEEYDRKMKEAFGDDYYGADDADENFQGYEGEEMPDFDVEDDTFGMLKGDGHEQESPLKAGFGAASDKVKELQKAGDNRDDSDENTENGGVHVDKPSRRKKKGKISLREKLAFDKQLEEYYKLDYEDMIDDLPTRFKYCQVKPNLYGLTATQILSTDDKDLNQFVSLKKLAPYRTGEWKPRHRFQGSQKARKKRALKKQTYEVYAQPDHEVVNGISLQPTGKDDLQQDNRDSNKRKKKRRKKQVSLSESRLIAYGNFPLPERKRKQS